MSEKRKYFELLSNSSTKITEDVQYHYCFSQIMVANLIKVTDTKKYLGELNSKQLNQQSDMKINSKTMLCHTFKSSILNKKSPDFCGISKCSIQAPIEIKMSGLIDTGSKGQLLSYFACATRKKLCYWNFNRLETNFFH